MKWIDMFNQVAIFNESNVYIDLIIIFLIILGGYFSQVWLKEINIPTTFKTIIMGTLFCLLYVWTKQVENTIEPGYWKKLLISYTVATSLYEVLIKWVHIGLKILYNKAKPYIKK